MWQLEVVAIFWTITRIRLRTLRDVMNFIKKTGEGFEVLTPMVMKSRIFWDTMTRSPLKSTDV